MDDAAWYERYFGADYLRIYRLADTADQLQLLHHLLAALPRGARLLDLPCGHGRHAVELALSGCEVYGLDLNLGFLQRARARAAEGQALLRLARGDMRWFPYADRSFDAAICMFTSLGYFNDDDQHEQVLAEFARVLKANALFVLDLANIDAVRVQPATAEWEKDGLRVASRYLWDEDSKRAVTIRDVTFADGGTARYESSVRLFEGAEIEAMLARRGFVVTDLLGSYRGESLGPTTPRRILICRRLAA